MPGPCKAGTSPGRVELELLNRECCVFRIWDEQIHTYGLKHDLTADKREGVTW